MTSSARLAFALMIISSLPMVAQRTGSGNTGSTGGSRAGTGTPSVTSVPQPGTGFPNTQSERQIMYISGAVVLQDGAPPPEPVAIERVCGASAHKEGYTDSKGRYQIQLGQNFELQDVSETGNSNGGFGTGRSGIASQSGMGTGGINPHDLMGCELRALLAGFQSSTVMIRPEGSFGEIRMDTITLQPLGGGSGSTISLTTMQAPGGAKHAYEKAQKAVAKENLKEAEKELTKAVQEFPKFAAAWALLGMVHQNLKDLDQAMKDFNQSIAADSQYVKPYFGLATIAAGQQNWKDAIRFGEQVTRLSPLAYPDAYFLCGVSYFNVEKMDEAERNLRKFLSLDADHSRPIAALYLGDVLARKQDFAGAAQQAKNYLAMAPNAPNSNDVREKLKKLEEMSGTAQKQ